MVIEQVSNVCTQTQQSVSFTLHAIFAETEHRLWCERTDWNDHLIINNAVIAYNIWFHITRRNAVITIIWRENFGSHRCIRAVSIEKETSSFLVFVDAYSFCHLARVYSNVYTQHSMKYRLWSIVLEANFVFAHKLSLAAWFGRQIEYLTLTVIWRISRIAAFFFLIFLTFLI